MPDVTQCCECDTVTWRDYLAQFAAFEHNHGAPPCGAETALLTMQAGLTWRARPLAAWDSDCWPSHARLEGFHAL